jgi:sodium/proline symporter
MLLPLSWLLGDLVFCSLFPGRINKLARDLNAVTLSEMLTTGIQAVRAKLIVAVTSIQAGGKFLSGASGITENIALLLFGASIVGYSCLGGFRGPVYADVLKAGIRIFGTLVALVAVIFSPCPTRFSAVLRCPGHGSSE